MTKFKNLKHAYGGELIFLNISIYFNQTEDLDWFNTLQEIIQLITLPQKYFLNIIGI